MPVLDSQMGESLDQVRLCLFANLALSIWADMHMQERSKTYSDTRKMLPELSEQSLSKST